MAGPNVIMRGCCDKSEYPGCLEPPIGAKRAGDGADESQRWCGSH